MSTNKLKEKIISNLKRAMKSYRTSKNITIEELGPITATTPNTVLIDVRSMQEYKEYHIDGAICIPYYEIQNRIQQEVADKNTLIILYCQSGIRSKKAMEILEKLGYKNIYHIKNGLDG